MIHLIYIYFICNAFCSGIALGDGKAWYWGLFMLLFGLPFCIIYVARFLMLGLAGLADKKLLLSVWFKFYFTNHFSKVGEDYIRIRRDQYLGNFKDKKNNMNAYERFFMRQLDKKYNYGITKEEKTNG